MYRPPFSLTSFQELFECVYTGQRVCIVCLFLSIRLFLKRAGFINYPQCLLLSRTIFYAIIYFREPA
jgi:hypothetical protein